MTAEHYRDFCQTYPLQSRTVAGNCWEYIDTGGSGEVLVLLPGGFGVADTSFRLILAFMPYYRVVSLSYPTDITTIDGLVAGIAGLLKAVSIEAAHVLGGSASGLVAQCLVRSHLTLVRSLILSHTGVPQPARPIWLAPLVWLCSRVPFALVRHLFHASVQLFLPGNRVEHKFWRSYFRARIEELSPSALWSRFHVLIDIDRHVHFTGADLAAWQHPLLIIAAEDDGFVGKREQAILRHLYPQAQYHLFRRGAHRDSVTAPEAEIAVIRQFLCCL